MQKHQTNLIYVLIMGVVSLFVYKVTMQIHLGNFNLLVEAAYGVVEGKPHWLAYQNRLLGPYLVHFISFSGLSFEFSLKLFILATMFAQNLLLFFLLRKMKMSANDSFLWVLRYCFAFICIHHYWYFTWDSIDAMIFTLFAWGILNSQSMTYFVGLFAIALLNRESALFIALYIALDSFEFKSLFRFRLASFKKLLTGIGLLVFGIVYTKFIRHYLFVSRPDGTSDAAHELIGNHVYLFDNLENMFINNLFAVDIVNTIVILAPVIYFMLFLPKYADKHIKALLMYMALVANIIIFGVFNETRMYIILIPFCIMMFIYKERLVTHTSDEQVESEPSSEPTLQTSS